jgi:hypothetical protein
MLLDWITMQGSKIRACFFGLFRPQRLQGTKIPLPSKAVKGEFSTPLREGVPQGFKTPTFRPLDFSSSSEQKQPNK